MCPPASRDVDQRTISGLVEAVRRVAVRCENGHFVAEVLETDGGVDDEPLGAPDAQIGVEEDNAVLALLHGRQS